MCLLTASNIYHRKTRTGCMEPSANLRSFLPYLMPLWLCFNIYLRIYQCPSSQLPSKSFNIKPQAYVHSLNSASEGSLCLLPGIGFEGIFLRYPHKFWQWELHSLNRTSSERATSKELGFTGQFSEATNTIQHFSLLSATKHAENEWADGSSCLQNTT